ADNATTLVEGAIGEQARVDALFRTDVDIDHHVPEFLRHAAHGLVAGDTGIVHDDVEAAVFLRCVGNDFRGVSGGNVGFQCNAANACGHLLEVVGHRRDIQHDDLGAVACQYFGNGRADTACGAGHQCCLAPQRLVPVKTVSAEIGGADIDALARY